MNDKGLDVILDRLRATPSQTLISRYLALIAEVQEPLKAKRALDLAEALIKGKTDEAMQIAHMVYRSDRSNLKAMDIMIQALTAKGRYGKAEVLKNERNKVARVANEREAAAGTGMSEMSLAVSGDSGFSAAAGGGEESRIAELDLGNEGQDSMNSGLLENLFPSEPPPAVFHADAPAPAPLAALRGPSADMFGSLAERPGDTFLPFRHSPGAVQAVAQAAPPPAAAGNDAPTIHLADSLSSHFPLTPQAAPPAPAEPRVEVAMSGLAAVAELFDYYWRQGFTTEARDLLKQTSAAAGHEAWWQARHALLEKSKLVFTPRVLGQAEESNVGPSPAAGAPFWWPLQEEMQRVASKGKALMVPLARVERLTELFKGQEQGAALPDEFVRALAEIDHRLSGAPPATVLTLKWELFQGLWGAAPDQSAALALEELELTHATPGFWGLYLDALTGGGSPRKALLEICRSLPKSPHLVWAKVAWSRLPLIWSLLEVHGFAWSEDDGVPALVTKLKSRPWPKLAGIVATAASGRR